MERNGLIYVRPREGLTNVRDEYSLAPIAMDGQWVKRTRITDRRLLQGDLIECEPPAEAEAPVDEAPVEDHEPAHNESEG